MTAFKTKVIVRMGDSDIAGIIFFANQFRFIHDAFEDMLAEHGHTLHILMQDSSFSMAIVHAESDYLAPIFVGDHIKIEAFVDHLGNTSFTMGYRLFKDNKLVGKASTVHVTFDKKDRRPITVPQNVRNFLDQYKDI